MIDRTSQLAQSAAEGLSRRGFLGRLGRGAGIAAAALGGLLLAGQDAEARSPHWCFVDSQCPPGKICNWGRCIPRNKKGKNK
jgi:hypothetical protein